MYRRNTKSSLEQFAKFHLDYKPSRPLLKAARWLHPSRTRAQSLVTDIIRPTRDTLVETVDRLCCRRLFIAFPAGPADIPGLFQSSSRIVRDIRSLVILVVMKPESDLLAEGPVGVIH